jgi:hypothetical protein
MKLDATKKIRQKRNNQDKQILTETKFHKMKNNSKSAYMALLHV